MSSLSKIFNLSGSRKQSGKLTPALSCTRTNVNAGAVESKSGGLLVFLTICFFVLPAEAKYEGGAGTAGDPYLIYTAEQMNEIGANPGDWNKHFMLIADVNMSDIAGTDYNIIENFTDISIT